MKYYLVGNGFFGCQKEYPTLEAAKAAANSINDEGMSWKFSLVSEDTNGVVKTIESYIGY